MIADHPYFVDLDSTPPHLCIECGKPEKDHKNSIDS